MISCLQYYRHHSWAGDGGRGCGLTPTSASLRAALDADNRHVRESLCVGPGNHEGTAGGRGWRWPCP